MVAVASGYLKSTHDHDDHHEHGHGHNNPPFHAREEGRAPAAYTLRTDLSWDALYSIGFSIQTGPALPR